MVMGKLTVYTRPDDDEIWDWARWKARQDRHSLSRIIVDALLAARSTHESALEKDREER